jgi:hypothetical protein
MLNSLILRLIARSSDSIVAFILALDTKLDTFLKSIDGEVAKFEDEIERIERDAAEKIADIRGDIADKAKNAATVAAIKAALPTGSVAE